MKKATKIISVVLVIILAISTMLVRALVSQEKHIWDMPCIPCDNITKEPYSYLSFPNETSENITDVYVYGCDGYFIKMYSISDCNKSSIILESDGKYIFVYDGVSKVYGYYRNGTYTGICLDKNTLEIIST